MSSCRRPCRDRRRSAWAGVRAVATVAAAASRKARIMVRSAGAAELCPGIAAASRAIGAKLRGAAENNPARQLAQIFCEAMCEAIFCGTAFEVLLQPYIDVTL